ncbi:MAG: T9SS type A sorting domain-containing protein [Bacteroidota bacterium]
MKKFRQFLQTGLLITFVFSLTANGQTPVSGGIYSNTTWTHANSPYIVTDTVVVFPNVVLTIEPGVIVKFNLNKRIEMRGAKLLAEGTMTDSITFSSNQITPSSGDWAGIVITGTISSSLSSRLKYCNIRFSNLSVFSLNYSGNLYINNCKFDNNNHGPNSIFAGTIIDSCIFTNNVYYGIYEVDHGIISNSIFNNSIVGINAHGDIIKNCTFKNNQTGIEPDECQILNCKLNNNGIGIRYSGVFCHVKDCIIDSNTYGIFGYSANDTVENNTFSYNGTGLFNGFGNPYGYIRKNVFEYDSVGVNLSVLQTHFECNKMCNNTVYDLVYSAVSGSTIDLSNNYWCTTDSLLIMSRIYDGYDNISFGLVNFMPTDTLLCYLMNPCSANFNLFPDSVVQHQYWAINMANGVPPLSYVWSWGDGTFDSTAFPSHIYSNSGYYTVCLTVTDSGECTNTFCNSSYLSKDANTMIYINVIPATGIKENMEYKSFSIFPNPVNDLLTVRLFQDNPEGNIKFYNLLGQNIYALPISSMEQIINVSDLSKGIYIIEVSTLNKTYKQKFIKQ